MTNKQSIQSHRKDEHFFLAEKFYQAERENDFDQIRFVHQGLPEISVTDVSIKPNCFKNSWTAPFYINAMTGGSPQTQKLNAQLAEIAELTQLPLATGSQSIALKDSTLRPSFTVVREKNPTGFIFANIGASHDYHAAQQAIEMTQADALQIHINAVQEIIMPEGDRDFYWLDNIAAIIAHVDVPVVVKEVGFGMSLTTMQHLQSIGVQTIDVSGTGGTNFAKIENERRPNKDYAYLSNWGQSTVESLLEAQSLLPDVTILASGGVRNPLDIVKALRLGASAVGLSGTILHLLLKQGQAQTVTQLLNWQLQIRDIMALLGVHNLAELRTSPIMLSPQLRHYLNERQLTLK